MAVTPYKPTSWGENEPAWASKLNDMTANDQWLFENSPRMLYTAYSMRRTEGIKIASGILYCLPSPSGIQQHRVEFGPFFSEGCKPVVVTGLMHNGEVRMTFGVANLNGGPYVDHRGFSLLGGAIHHEKSKAFTKGFWIPWIAIGY